MPKDVVGDHGKALVEDGLKLEFLAHGGVMVINWTADVSKHFVNTFEKYLDKEKRKSPAYKLANIHEKAKMVFEAMAHRVALQFD